MTRCSAAFLAFAAVAPAEDLPAEHNKDGALEVLGTGSVKQWEGRSQGPPRAVSCNTTPERTVRGPAPYDTV